MLNLFDFEISTLLFTSFSVYYFNSFDFAENSPATAQASPPSPSHVCGAETLMKGCVNVNTAGVMPYYVGVQQLYDGRSLSFLHDIYLNIISPDLLKLNTELLKNAILNQIKNNGPHNPMDYLKWLTLSNLIDSQESDRLNELLLHDKIEEFYNEIPRRFKYDFFMENYFFITNDKIYICETVAKSYMTPNQIAEKLDRSEFIFLDILPQLKPKIPMVSPLRTVGWGPLDSVKELLTAQPLYNIISIFLLKAFDLFEGFFKYFTSLFQEERCADRTTSSPTMQEVAIESTSAIHGPASWGEQVRTDVILFSSPETVTEPKLYIFYLNASDLYNSTGDAAVVKGYVNAHNSVIVPMDKIQHSKIWDYYKSH